MTETGAGDTGVGIDGDASAAASGSAQGPRKRSFSIRGHRTSLSLEEEFWICLKDIAAARGVSMAALVTEIDASRGRTGLSSAIRVFILRDLRQRAFG